MKEHLLTLKIPGANGTPQEIQAPSGVPTGGLGDGGNTILGSGITLFLIACILLALGFLIYGGISYIMSGGDKAKVESSRLTIVYAIVGLVVAFLSFFIVNLFLHSLDSNLSIFNLSL